MYKVFLDSDVVISSLISNFGASHVLINSNNCIKYISDVSYRELLTVVEKLAIEVDSLINLLKEKLKVVKLQKNIKEIKKDYGFFVKDFNDAHILAGAIEAKVNFLITFNLKDFEINKIKEKYNIKIMTPGNFLQFLRSK